MEKVIRELSAFIIMGLMFTTVKYFNGFEAAVLCGLSIIYSMHFRK